MFQQQQPNQLEMMIQSACNPEFYEPNLALNMEIVDQINQRATKGFPRQAALAIVKLVNDRNPNSASLALNVNVYLAQFMVIDHPFALSRTLLDQCVKNCGYPFHLIVGTKDFLNELVRRFPERPLQGVGPVQYRILELIQQWNATLCRHSRYKEDFKNINDMYNLLMYKGYRFPQLQQDSANVMAPKEELKTEEELEEEDKVAQGAKLQELLRLGTPAALEQANDLMKIMAGYDMEKRPDYKKQVNEELDRIEHRAMVLNDVLNSKSPKDRKTHDPNLEELHATAKTAQTRIQKLVSDGDDDSRIGRLLELNDLINTVITKYADYKAGKPITRDLPGFAFLDPQANESPRTGPISLIDFDGPPATQTPTGSSSLSNPPTYASSSGSISPSKSVSPSKTPTNLLDDLSGLSFSDNPNQQPSSLPLTTPSSLPHTQQSNAAILANFGKSNHSGASTPVMNSSIRQQQQAPAGASLLGDLTGIMSLQQQQPSSIMSGSAGATKPFTATLWQTTVPNANLSITSTSSGGGLSTSTQDPFDALGLGLSKPSTSSMPVIPANTNSITPQQQPNQPPRASNEFLEFQSAAPVPPPTSSSKSFDSQDVVLLAKNGLRVVLRLMPSDSGYQIQAGFTNTTPVPFTQLVFALAVPKTMSLTMDNVSSTTIPPLGTGAVFQSINVVNSAKDSLRMRFKVSYQVNNIPVEESGEYVYK
ncbi:hypothetical protein SmJEL517_g04196 [Synchytrium microbalum]|uniref:VHS domain-containing protein n=1 Tax=Synchytrium microbalum TaxID=1806994 RepID=A0A507C008_9FUNG|nr:uncharacterized protein SmJEL517_g04196 [Synchytrium microbalum]TPX32721.1 hypothetical protein SmJEL517_g04196 [Synchytrium microbalum]